MNPTISSDPSGTFRLEGTLDIYSAECLLRTLADCLASSDTITLDLGGVETCDTAGIQLLLSARVSASEQNKSVQFRDVPESIATCCRRLGLPVLA
jgi:ABC-type transporter Mla MlaB component